MPRTIIFSIVSIASILVFLSCDILPPVKQQHIVPRFSVDPLSNSGISNSIASSSPVKTNPSYMKNPFSLFHTLMIKQAMAQGNSSFIDCTPALNDYNNHVLSPSFRNGIYFVKKFYYTAISNDCYARAISQSERLGSTVEQLESINTDRDGNETPVFKEVVLLSVKKINDPENDVLFISWTDDPELKNVQGRMVTKRLQLPEIESNIHVKNRIDLNISNGFRSVDVMQKAHERTNNFFEYDRAIFKEIPDADGNVKEHHVAGRYYIDTNNEILELQASVKKGIGTSVFLVYLESCSRISINVTGSSNPGDCQVRTKEEYYDRNGESILPSRAAAIGLKMDNSSLPRVDSFFDNQSEDSFYTPEFN